MKLRYYSQTNHHLWCILESEPIGPKWSIVDCYDKAFIGMEYMNLNEFQQIHSLFVEDKNYRYSIPMHSPETLNELRNIKWLNDISKECNHKFIPYVGAFETFDYCIHCDKKKVA